MEEILQKEQQNLEQPDSIKECNQELDNNLESVAPVEEDGSINKFKSVKALEEAYVNLEKEFTKKCQKVSELEKSVADNVTAPAKTKEQTEEEFFSQTPLAQKYRSEIAEYVSNNDVSLENAYAKILEKIYKPNEELIHDENFINEYIMKDSKIKQKIIGEYLTDLMSNKKTPLITETSGSNINILPKLKPTSIKEAGEIAEAMLKL